MEVRHGGLLGNYMFNPIFANISGAVNASIYLHDIS